MSDTVTPVPEIRHDGITYRLPFARLFRPHTPAERAALSASIGELGCMVRVVVYDSATWGRNCVIDGASRLELVAELGKTVPVVHRGHLPDERAEREAISLNTDRRQLSPEDLRAFRESRNADIVADRIEGDSLQVIADRHGLSRTSVVQILAEAGVQDRTPEKVTGTDGKTYPATTGRAGERTPEQQLDAARRSCATLFKQLDALLHGAFSERLRAILARHHADEQTLAIVRAVINDLAAEVAVEQTAAGE